MAHTPTYNVHYLFFTHHLILVGVTSGSGSRVEPVQWTGIHVGFDQKSITSHMHICFISHNVKVTLRWTPRIRYAPMYACFGMSYPVEMYVEVGVGGGVI